MSKERDKPKRPYRKPREVSGCAEVSNMDSFLDVRIACHNWLMKHDPVYVARQEYFNRSSDEE